MMLFAPRGRTTRLCRPCAHSTLGTLGFAPSRWRFAFVYFFFSCRQRCLGSALAKISTSRHLIFVLHFFFSGACEVFIMFHSLIFCTLPRKGIYGPPVRTPPPLSRIPTPVVRFAVCCCQARGLPTHPTSPVTKSPNQTHHGRTFSDRSRKDAKFGGLSLFMSSFLTLFSTQQ